MALSCSKYLSALLQGITSKHHNDFYCLNCRNRTIENEHNVWTSKDCIKNFSGSLRGHTIKIINFKKKKMKLWTKE